MNRRQFTKSALAASLAAMTLPRSLHAPGPAGRRYLANIGLQLWPVRNQLAKDVRNPIVNAADPDAYPIAGLTFLLVYKDQPDPAKARALAQFIQWAMTDGQDVVESLDYARLPETVVKVNEMNLMTLTAGGKPVLASQ